MCDYCQEEKIRSLKYSKINPNEYINKRYGNVTITDCYWIKEKRYRLYVDYKCDCGNVKSCTLDHLKSGRIKSCGCLKNIIMVKRNTKHNLYKEYKRIFDVWNNMIQRCYNKKNPNYKNYGERGIKVCKEWQCLNNFVDWAYKNGYIEKDKANRKEVLSIERIDVNGNYEPNNCKWIPFCEQGKNKRYSGRQCVGRELKEADNIE